MAAHPQDTRRSPPHKVLKRIRCRNVMCVTFLKPRAGGNTRAVPGNSAQERRVLVFSDYSEVGKAKLR